MQRLSHRISQISRPSHGSLFSCAISVASRNQHDVKSTASYRSNDARLQQKHFSMSQQQLDPRTRATQRYQLLSRIPTVADGTIFTDIDEQSGQPAVCAVELAFKHRDFLNNTQTGTRRSFVQRSQGVFLAGSAFPVADDPSIVMQSVSPSQNYMLQIVKTSKEGADKLSYDLRVWSRKSGSLLQQIPVDDGTHGIVANDQHFTRVVWNKDESAVLYEAEPAKKKKQKYWQQSAAAAAGAVSPTKVSTDVQEDSDGYYTFTDREDFGEGLVDRKLPRLFICRWQQRAVPELVAGIPEYLAVAYAAFTPNEDGIVFTGYDLRNERRLGLKYCLQRPCALYLLPLSEPAAERKVQRLTSDETHTARTPVFTPDGKTLLYLSMGKVGHHSGCQKIGAIDWQSKKESVLVDKVYEFDGIERCAQTDDDAERAQIYTKTFPGIFATHLNPSWFGSVQQREYLLVNSSWRSTNSILAVSVADGRVFRLTPNWDSEMYVYESLVLLDHDAKTNTLLAVQSSPRKPYQILLGTLEEQQDGSLDVSGWSVVEDSRQVLPQECIDVLDSYSWSIHYVPVGSQHSEDEIGGKKKKVSTMQESIVLKPRNNTGPYPLITFPHGGPHSVVPTSYSQLFAFMASQGYFHIVPAYRGSVGFGENFVDVLPGFVGDMDVKDVHRATQYALNTFGDLIDKDKIVASGGSHGGFLSLHLVGQHPDVYKAAITRNPVVNMASNIHTDITDWVFYEANAYDITEPLIPDAKLVVQQFESSPIAHVNKVQANVLLLVGEVDRRVPPSQGREYYYALLARKKRGDYKGECAMNLYPGNAHPLDKPSEEADSTISSILFLEKHLQ